MVHARWQSCADTWGIGDLAAALEPATRPCFRLAKLKPGPHVVGGSRLGGSPDLPADVGWPSVEGATLDFLVQLDLASLEPNWLPGLPTTGYLWIFADRSGETYPCPASILYADVRADALQRRDAEGATSPARVPVFVPSFELLDPEDLVDDSDRIDALPHEETVLGGLFPAWDGGDMPVELALADLGLAEVAGFTSYDDARFDEEIERHATATPEWAHEHARHLETVVRPRWRSCLERKTEVEARAAGYRVLASLESEDELDWCWGDAGVLVLAIHEEDLLARRFERVAVRLRWS